MDLFMRDSDAFSWYMERDPVLRSTVVAVVWLDRSPDWSSLAAKVDRATRLAPTFRSLVVDPPGRLANPRWASDPEFDLAWHLRRIEAPAPRSQQVVVELARCEAMSAFDRARPLWRFTLVEGLEGGRAALVMKLHHSLTDGLGGMDLGLLLFDEEPGSSAGEPVGGDPPAQGQQPAQGQPPARHERRTDPIMGGIGRSSARLAGVVAGGARSALPVAVHMARHPLSSAKATLRTSRSIYRTVAPTFHTLSPVMTERGLRRRLDLLEADLEDLSRAAASQGGTVNDGFLAGAVTAMRLYHERHGTAPQTLRVTLPISIRKPGDPMGGNRITLMRRVVPVSDLDPSRLIPEMKRMCRGARDEPSLEHADTIAGVLNLLPRQVVAGLLKHIDFVASDVRGFPFAVYLGDSRVEAFVGFAPTIGASVNLTLLSYSGRCHVGVTVDCAAIPDHDVFVECLRQGFEEVLALGGVHAPVHLPLHDDVPVPT